MDQNFPFEEEPCCCEEDCSAELPEVELEEPHPVRNHAVTTTALVTVLSCKYCGKVVDERTREGDRQDDFRERDCLPHDMPVCCQKAQNEYGLKLITEMGNPVPQFVYMIDKSAYKCVNVLGGHVMQYKFKEHPQVCDNCHCTHFVQGNNSWQDNFLINFFYCTNCGKSHKVRDCECGSKPVPDDKHGLVK